MSSSQEKLGAIGLGGGLLVLVIAVSVASGIISGLGGTTVSEATARSLMMIVVGGSILAIVLIGVSAYLLINQSLARMLAAPPVLAEPSAPPAPAGIAEPVAQPAPAASAEPSAPPAEVAVP